jgi:hypothetical protein
MLARWSFTCIAAAMLLLGIWRVLHPTEAKITLLPVAAHVTLYRAPPKTGTFQEPPPMVVSVYDLSDIVMNAAKDSGGDKLAQAQLLQIIQSHVAPLSWPNRGGSATMYEVTGHRVVIAQTQEAHQQIGDLLQAIRRADGLKWAWKAK